MNRCSLKQLTLTPLSAIPLTQQHALATEIKGMLFWRHVTAHTLKQDVQP